MNQVAILQIISYFFSFSLLLQCIEMIAISRKDLFLQVWSSHNLQSSLLFKKLYSEKGFQFLLFFQLAMILVLAIYPAHPLIVLVLALTHLLVCIRFRGLFNGGSDMMVFVVATGLILGGKLGLIYIAIHTCYSYFKAGIAKVKQPSWRSGLAINQFLGISLYPNIQKLNPRKPLSLILSYSVLGFELLIPLIFVFPKIAPFYFAIAIAFHILNCLVFGLNRFLWIWLAAWPAVLYCTEIIKF